MHPFPYRLLLAAAIKHLHEARACVAADDYPTAQLHQEACRALLDEHYVKYASITGIRKFWGGTTGPQAPAATQP